MSGKGLISIVIPVYNVEGEFTRCLDSVLGQTYGNLEVILVDDGSTDGSGLLCDEAASRDGRVKVIHKENGGLSSARNTGLRTATGDWLLYVDSDDAIMPDACEALLDTGRKSKADLVMGDAVHETSDGKEAMSHDCLEPGTLYTARDGIIKLIKNHEFYAPACFNMYKPFLLKKNNLFFAEGILHEDMEMQPRLFLSMASIAYSGRTFYRYIDRSTSIMNASDAARRRRDLSRIYASWKTCFDSVGDPDLQRALYGYLCKCYLHSCLELGPIDLGSNGINSSFLFRYGLDVKEKAKAMVYGLSPRLWAKMGGGLQ